MIHSCSYYCDRPECVKGQRDLLRDMLFTERKPLTDEQLRGIARNLSHFHGDAMRGYWPSAKLFAAAIERAHGITEKEASNAG